MVGVEVGVGRRVGATSGRLEEVYRGGEGRYKRPDEPLLRGSRPYLPGPYQETNRPMATFNDREKAFEDKYKHDQDLQFRTMVRRNKLLGLWVARELLGLEGDAAEAYAKEVVASDFEQPGPDDVVLKIMSDLQAKGVDYSEHRLRHRMDELMAEAKHQIMSE
jgi:hypothetical protein